MQSFLKYIEPYSLIDGKIDVVVDATNWAIDEAIIKVIRVITFSTDWDLTIFCDRDQTSGMFESVKIASNASGEQIILLDLPYVDNDSNNAVHCLFVDNAYANPSIEATIEIFGQKARIT